ncbi:MAG: rod shape-determining protein RodA [Lachnospiraceae bacterium]|nr:rod shape-determining protein RodA [Lachnospiraceae bacterium]
MFKFSEYRVRYLNFRLMLYVWALTAIGIIFIRSATMVSGGSAMEKQIFGAAVGTFLMLFLMLVDYKFVLKLWPLVFLFSIGLLLIVRSPLGFGGDTTGAQRWVDLPGIGAIQPSEFCKILMILTWAAYFSVFSKQINNVFVLIGGAALLGGNAVLILLQPDLSTTIVFCVIFVIMLYVAGISYKWIGGVVAALIPVGIFGLYYIQQPGMDEHYQVRRILSWLYPDRYSVDVTAQQRHSIMAIGSGQLYGKGLFNNSVYSMKNADYLMEEDTDFIFSVIGEETGFVGCTAVILLLFLIVVECIYTGIRARDLAGRLICIGMAALVSFQAFTNICVNTGLFPNTGLPLPFVSAGLSSLISLYLGMGFVLNVSIQRKRSSS